MNKFDSGWKAKVTLFYGEFLFFFRNIFYLE